MYAITFLLLLLLRRRVHSFVVSFCSVFSGNCHAAEIKLGDFNERKERKKESIKLQINAFQSEILDSFYFYFYIPFYVLSVSRSVENTISFARLILDYIPIINNIELLLPYYYFYDHFHVKNNIEQKVRSYLKLRYEQLKLDQRQLYFDLDLFSAQVMAHEQTAVW